MHYKAAQAYLDKKAAQGLELRKIYLGCVARFEKAENPVILWTWIWKSLLPGFDECYISYANGHSEYGYLLFRQGNVVAMAGCFDGLRPLDMTTPEALDLIRACLLP